MAGDWTLERVILAPARVAELLNAAEVRSTLHNRRVNDLLEANNRYLQDGRNWKILKHLRAGEGSSVLLFSDSRVTCIGDWTDWHAETFTGNTIDEALGLALVAFNERSRST